VGGNPPVWLFVLGSIVGVLSLVALELISVALRGAKQFRVVS
jgi:hypothetical protein